MEYIFHILVICGIYVILTISLNLLIGYTGQAALGHAAFSLMGAYTSSLLALNYGVSPWLGLLAGAGSAALVSLLIAYPAMRLTGDYVAFVTLGFGIIVYSVAKNWTTLTRGPLGLPGIPAVQLIGWDMTTSWAYLCIVAVMGAMAALIIGRVVRAPFGRILAGIREDEVATLAMGKNVLKFKVKAFFVSAFFTGLAGSLYAHYIRFVDPSSFTVMESITILLMVVFGGAGSLKGSVLGAIILVVFPELLRFFGLSGAIEAPLRQLFYGLLLVLLMLYRPQGLVGRFKFR